MKEPNFKEFIQFISKRNGYYLNEAECKWLSEQIDQIEKMNEQLTKMHQQICDVAAERFNKITELESLLKKAEKALADVQDVPYKYFQKMERLK